MKKSLIILLVSLVAISLFVGCKEPEKVYKVGDKGPAGGWIFYDKGSYSDGWRYLEVAPTDADGGYICWKESGDDNYSTGEDIGTGKSNTDNLLAASGVFPAAQACADYGNDTAYDDWFLPSLKELECLGDNKIKIGGLSSLGGDNYWTSTVASAGTVHCPSIDLSNGGTVACTYGKTTNSGKVRPIRSF